jgi:hypothetical protein
VDWVLDRLGQELDSLRGELAAVRAAHGIDTDGEGQRPAAGTHAMAGDDADNRDDT